jgi:glycosyltransferase involved in cell wall biosynthesis
MKISVALCTYNGAKYLPEQLQSYLAQTRLPDELVVCDDGSTDATFSILENFRDTSSFPVIIARNEKQLGVIKNFEKAFSLCSGDVICPSDQDDVWMPEKLSLIEKAFTGSDRIGAVYANASIVDEDLSPTGMYTWRQKNFTKDVIKDFQEGRGFERLLNNCDIFGSSMAFRSQYRGYAMPLPEGLCWMHDTWMAAIIASVAEIAMIETPLIKYRQHAAQSSHGFDLKKKTPFRGIKETIERKNPLLHASYTLETLRDRLLTRKILSPARKEIIDAAIGHLTLRAEMPAGRFARISIVVKELRAGNYRLYSNGYKSAARDLLFS